MKSSAPQITVMTWLGLTVWVAVTIWLFRQSALWGIIGLSVFKHVAIAQLCQTLGVDRRTLPANSGVGGAGPVALRRSGPRARPEGDPETPTDPDSAPDHDAPTGPIVRKMVF